MKATLEACGYRVLTAENGRDAIGLFDEHRSEIRAVVTDLMMPIMDGRATIRVLSQIDPHVRIIATSGLADDPKVAANVRPSVRALLRKPIHSSTLLKTVHQVITS
jgi:CheY-like chemotaxis protein